MLIPSKLSRPVRQQNTVVRDRLLTKLATAPNYRLTLVASPAGYGKTTLVAHWAAGKSDLGWYSLDESDNQPERFASYLIAAVQHACGGHCVKSEALSQKHQYASLSALFAQLFVELSDWHRPLLLVIDDYHLICNDAIHEGMRFFLRHQPENMSLVVLSRTLPPLGIANMRVREQLLELNASHLAFTHPETQQFFDNRLKDPIDQADSSRLCDDVAGWATALQLIALSARQSATSSQQSTQQSARKLAGLNASHLSEYLADEVLDRVDAPTRDFLLRCSLLRSMNDALIVRLTGGDNGQQRLEELERQGLFIHRMDDTGEWFNFHPLFATFLRQRCQWELATELPQIHRAAAEGWLAQGFPAEAIHHALGAEDTDMLRDILLQHAWALFNQSELALLEECLAALPYDRLIQNPKLVLLQAWLAQSQHRYAEVEALLARAESEMQQRNIVMEQDLTAEFDALRAQVAINDGRQDEAEKLAADALRFLPYESYYSRIVATSVTGEIQHCKGDLTRALPLMQQTEQIARRYEAYHYALWALLQQSEILIAQGFLQAAFEMQDRAFELVREQHLEQLPMHEFLLRLRSQLLWSWSRLDDAEDAARQGLDVLTNFQPQQQLQCLAMLAKCSLARGQLDNAHHHLQRCESLLKTGQYHIDWMTNTDKPRVIYWQMIGDKTAARQWLQQARKPDMADNHFQQGQWRNIARVQILLEQFDEAEVVLDELNQNARQLRLTSDLNRNLLLSNLLYWHTGRKSDAQRVLIEALGLANRTGFVSHFVIEGEMMAQQLRQLIQLNLLPELEQRRAQQILREINQHHRHKFAHFDEGFVNKLLTHPQVPELIRTSPLTQREWQVLGLIYSGYSNDQIAGELDVASTTIKTHIRNLYQKLGVAHRQEAVQQAQHLLQVMGYGA
ncbi:MULTISPECIES: HTH-type transcriptional regulator MalT [Rahnella]|jgi:LuxR family maltose regulon positive regulatory protein|uniref:HTH-type transcriptional regulator MalT n=1 Tax=Rahnella contaminans TaxID=2703882 RepID=A0A6M2B559_9GAMM|nr:MULTISPECIES: HTH-type transcriptional regulator MalT [Rahnella]KAB8309780.1 HTH-type transcriptional regulator MalT [Rouxiella chamberiensis]MBU9818547.1 HTH-type transcriptional regulator MalT [Rahnella sp. BCC 1045]MCS3424089.1 LuxR family maltose regulon positive regulatory protein [Rahnella sp. BIGb0603]NGX87407.1 HTH-type transcriptional regulator MalT [Rahnella contaminans]